jgi:predicted anti-sigma-YlaC factor YlaD
MPLSKQQIDTLLTLVVNSTPDSMSCDGCLVNVAQFVEAELMGASLCDSMQKVQNHLQNCPCCNDEYQALLAALESVEV